MLTKDDVLYGKDGDGYTLTLTGGTDHIPCLVTKVTSTNDGKVTLTINFSANTPEMIAETKILLGLQRGECILSLQGIKREFD